MKKILLGLATLALLVSCATINDKTKKFDLRKDCDQTGSKKTLSDIFCKKKSN